MAHCLHRPFADAGQSGRLRRVKRRRRGPHHRNRRRTGLSPRRYQGRVRSRRRNGRSRSRGQRRQQRPGGPTCHCFGMGRRRHRRHSVSGNRLGVQGRRRHGPGGALRHRFDGRRRHRLGMPRRRRFRWPLRRRRYRLAGRMGRARLRRFVPRIRPVRTHVVRKNRIRSPVHRRHVPRHRRPGRVAFRLAVRGRRTTRPTDHRRTISLRRRLATWQGRLAVGRRRQRGSRRRRVGRRAVLLEKVEPHRARCVGLQHHREVDPQHVAQQALQGVHAHATGCRQPTYAETGMTRLASLRQVDDFTVDFDARRARTRRSHGKLDAFVQFGRGTACEVAAARSRVNAHEIVASPAHVRGRLDEHSKPRMLAPIVEHPNDDGQ